MAFQVEMNGPANIKLLFAAILRSLMAKDFKKALKLAQDGMEASNQMLNWFLELKKLGVELPVGWTEFIHRKSIEKR